MLKRAVFVLALTGATAAYGAEPLTLDQAFRNAYRDNATLQAARYALDAVREQYPQARAGYLPTIGAEASVVSTTIDTSNFRAGDGATTKGGSLVLEQPVFRGFRTEATVERARAAIAAEEQRVSQVSQDVFLNTVRAYMDVIRDRLILTLRTKNKGVIDAEKTSAEARFEAGDVTKTDVKQTESRYARALADEAIAASALRRSEAVFEDVTGNAPPDVLVMPDVPFTFPEERAVFETLAEAQNPAILRAAYDARVADSDVKAAGSDFYPQVTAFASTVKEYDPQPGIVSDTANSAIGLRASINLYEGGAAQSRVREAKSRASQRLAEKAQVQSGIISGLVSDWKRYRALETEIAARELEITAARFTSDGLREEAKLGERTVFDALEAEQDVLDAETGLVLARREQVVTGYSLASALGMLTPARLRLDTAITKVKPTENTVIHTANQ